MTSRERVSKDDGSAEPYGLKALPELYASWAATGTPWTACIKPSCSAATVG